MENKTEKIELPPLATWSILSDEAQGFTQVGSYSVPTAFTTHRIEVRGVQFPPFNERHKERWWTSLWVLFNSDAEIENLHRRYFQCPYVTVAVMLRFDERLAEGVSKEDMWMRVYKAAFKVRDDRRNKKSP